MKCEEWEIWISAYHDDALDPERLLKVEAHLTGCEACREYNEAITALEPMLRSAMVRVDAPETLFGRVMSQIPEPVGASPRRRPTLRPPRGWLSFGLAPVGVAICLLMARQPPDSRVVTAPTVESPASTSRPEAPKAGGSTRRSVKPGSGARPSSGAPAPGASPSKAAPTAPPEPRPELAPLRRLNQRRPRRFQDDLAYDPSVRRHRSSSRRHARRRSPLLANNPAPRTMAPRSAAYSGPSAPASSWLSVVDYVLPRADPETSAGEGTVFVLPAAETYAATPTRYEY